MPNRTYQEDFYRSQCLQQNQQLNNHQLQCHQSQYTQYPIPPSAANNSYYNTPQLQPSQLLSHPNQTQVYHPDYYSKTTQLPLTTPASLSLPSHSAYDKEWLPDSRVVSDIEKGLRLTDKIETIEITSKDLSPASCCSNFDLLLHDYYNQGNKNYTDFPSCSQIQSDTIHHQNKKQVKYCSIQKPNYDCNYILNNLNTISNISNQTNDCFQDVFPSALPNDICADLNFDSVGVVEGGIDEDSDIIVEDLDDDDDYIEEHEEDAELDSRKFNCLLCNVSYSPAGSQFYLLTAENPVTMSSQKAVSAKLQGIIGGFTHNYLCCQCLGLINAIDHLEMKLQDLKDDLIKKYELSNKVKIKKKVTKGMKCAHKLTCKLCKRSINLVSIYRNHIRKHKVQKRFLCEICGKRFVNLKIFQVHMKNHDVQPQSKVIEGYCCIICKKLFRTKSNLKEHSNVCSGKLPFKCTKCYKKFPTTTKLKNHIKLKHEKKFTSICSICNIGFIQISDYKRHMISHSTLKKFNCTQCDKSYKTLSNLNFHMKFHAKNLPFICEVCSKGFMRKEYLESHRASHTGEKNYACTMCDKKFVSQKNLDAHVKHHNGNINKKSCNICGKVISKIALEDHLRTHSNLKEFKCDNCEERFNTKSSLQKHKKRKHT